MLPVLEPPAQVSREVEPELKDPSGSDFGLLLTLKLKVRLSKLDFYVIYY